MRRRSAPRRRGAAAAYAVAMLLAVSALIAVGLRARTNDLSFERRSLTRVCARWAAESALARGRAELAGDLVPRSAGPLSGGLANAKVRYEITAERSGPTMLLVADGWCSPEGEKPSALRIRARYKLATKQLVSWEEGPLP